MSISGTPDAMYNVQGNLNHSDIMVVSAYDEAVKNGFVGTKKEWLASLKGEKGDPYELTENDKTEITSLVLAALPTWKGGSY